MYITYQKLSLCSEDILLLQSSIVMCFAPLCALLNLTICKNSRTKPAHWQHWWVKCPRMTKSQISICAQLNLNIWTTNSKTLLLKMFFWYFKTPLRKSHLKFWKSAREAKKFFFLNWIIPHFLCFSSGNSDPLKFLRNIDK